MRIIFMGSPDFAVPSLKYLIDSKHEVIGVFTQTDKVRGRGNKFLPTPVKKVAVENNIKVYQPKSLKSGDDATTAFEVLKELNPDLMVVVAYGKILPKNILEVAKYGCINIHASLLPRYRGAAPIQRCILDGETKTGVTSMQMAEGLDTGDMLVKAETEIGENETASELHDRLAKMGAKVLAETLGQLENGTLKPEKQDDSLSNYASMLTKDMSRLDFSESAKKIHNTIRAITGFGELNGKRLKIYRSQIVEKNADGYEAGTIIDEKNFIVVCGDGNCVQFLEVQAEGGKRLKTADYLRGNKIEKGMKIE